MAGPISFVGAWSLAGVATPGYSPIDNAISDLAAVHAPTRVTMTTGFVVFGVGLIAFGVSLRELLESRAWIAASAAGACSIAVAATPLGGWSGDEVHATFAGLGYASIVALPLLASASIAKTGQHGWARASILTGALSCGCLLASTLGPAHGLWQRLGLTVGDLWIALTALGLITELAPVSDST